MAKKDTPKAQNEPAEPQNILVTSGVPPALVRVKEGNTMTYEGQEYGPGDEVEIEGPQAQQLVLMGFVEFV